MVRHTTARGPATGPPVSTLHGAHQSEGARSEYYGHLHPCAGRPDPGSALGTATDGSTYRAGDLLPLEARGDGAIAVRTEDDRRDSEGDQHDAGCDPTEL